MDIEPESGNDRIEFDEEQQSAENDDQEDEEV
jgi:hypothetical protein